jgi:hypothetical protein
VEIDDAVIDTLARATHENYLADQGSDGPQWANLREDLREANRAQIRAIPEKLASIWASIEQGTPSEPFAFTPAELERLAKVEHRRWMAQRRRAGWVYAAVRDDRRKQHPMIVEWERLPEYERDKDRRVVSRIPDLLARVGMHIVRRPPVE